jgi:uncharacterized membrane protein
MTFALLKVAHVLAIVLWVGGMLFAHFFLRPALVALEPAPRLRLMQAVLDRFLGAVLVAVLVVLSSGVMMIGEVRQQVLDTGGHFSMPLSWSVMAALGLLMTAVFGHVRWPLFKRLSRALETADLAAAAAALAQIRSWVMANLVIGLVVIVVAVGGGV